MICPKCGHEMPDGAKFCTDCGALLEVKPSPAEEATAPTDAPAEAVAATPAPAAATPAPAKKTSAPFDLKKFVKEKRNYLIAAGCVLLAVILLAVIISARGAKTPADPPVWDEVYSDPAEKTFFFVDNKLLSGVAIDEKVWIRTTSENGKTAVARSATDNTWYVIHGKKVQKIEDLTSFRLSEDGKYGAFVTTDGVLYSYKVSNGAKTKIASDVNNYRLSPDGKTILFNTDSNSEKYKTELKVATSGGKTVSLAHDASPLALSDGGKYIYYRNDDNDMYVVKNKKSEKVTKLGAASNIVYNADYSEVIFSCDESLYICKKAAEKTKIGKGNWAMPICMVDWDGASNNTKRIEKFLGQAFIVSATNDGKTTISLVWISSKGESETIVKNLDANEMFLIKNMLYYLDAEGSFRAVKVKKGAESVKIAKNVARLYSSEKGKFYYITDDGDLLYTTGTKEGKRIAEDVRSCAVSKDGKYVYFLTKDDELKLTKNQGKPKPVAIDVQRYWVPENGSLVAYTVKDGNETLLYVAKGGKNPNRANDYDGGVILSDDGKSIAYLDSEGELMVANPRGKLSNAKKIRK